MTLRHICDAERACIMEKFEELGGTLDGYPALICGRQIAFPTVHALSAPSNISAEFTWITLRRAVYTGKVALRSR
jgi:hypothetical protein